MTSKINALNTVQKLSGFILGAALFSASLSIQADTNDRGWFVGGTISNMDTSVEGEFSGDYGDDSGLGISVIGGFNFNSFFGLEGQLFSVDELEAEYSESYNGNTYTYTSEYSMAGLSFTPKFTARLNQRFSLYGKFGLSSFVFIDEDDYDDTWGNIVFTYGFGSNIDLTDHLKLRVSFDYYEGTLEPEDSEFEDIEAELSQLGIGMYFQF